MRPSIALVLSVSLITALACGGGEAEAEVAATAPAGAAAATAQPATPEPEPEEFDVASVPEDLRSGSAASRLAAIGAHQDDPAMTAALVWVLRNDADAPVRKRAWKALRTRWEKNVGAGAEHEEAAVWAAANAETETRVAALDALGALSRNLELPAKHLADPAEPVRAAAASAVFGIANRTGARSDAKALLQDRLALESSGPLRRKLAGWIGKL